MFTTPLHVEKTKTSDKSARCQQNIKTYLEKIRPVKDITRLLESSQSKKKGYTTSSFDVSSIYVNKTWRTARSRKGHQIFLKAMKFIYTLNTIYLFSSLSRILQTFVETFLLLCIFGNRRQNMSNIFIKFVCLSSRLCSRYMCHRYTRHHHE